MISDEIERFLEKNYTKIAPDKMYFEIKKEFPNAQPLDIQKAVMARLNKPIRKAPVADVAQISGKPGYLAGDKVQKVAEFSIDGTLRDETPWSKGLIRELRRRLA